ncbi:MAG: HDIG domain-containing protein [Anaerolineales bacterium]|nr:HDIG domain-containing protein [Anaerolineales bacterium]
MSSNPDFLYSSPPVLAHSRWRIFWLSLFTLAMSGLIWVALVYIYPLDTGSLDLHLGTVAPVDLVAPKFVEFESELLTAEAREAAARGASLAYTPTDPGIARQQVDALRAAVTFISTTRADSFASYEQKLEDLAVLDAAFDRPLAEEILLLTDEQWQAVMTEAVLVLQQVMRSTIRDGQVEEARRSIPSLVSFALPEEQVPTVTGLVSLYVVPNSFYSEELTEERRQQARDAVFPVVRTFVEGETVVRSGKVLSEADIEALQELGLLVGGDDPLSYLNAGGVVILSMTFILLFLYRRPAFSGNFKQILYTSFFFLVFLYLGRVIILQAHALPYIFPLTGFGLLIGALFGPQPGMFFMLPLSFLMGYGMPAALEVTIYFFLSGVFGVLVLDRARRVVSYVWAGAWAGVIGAGALLTFRLLDPFTDWNTLAIYVVASLVNGVASGIIALLLLFTSAPLLGKVTIIQLTELSRPDHPLLKFILLTAPGTYQHSLQVANLAEQAAEQIGADALLTRIGALYHDAGKALAPQYFIENQIPGAGNPHENIDPYESSAIIIRHVTDGLDLAHKHHLPDRIIDFIAEHHGTTATRFQYAKAIQAAGGDASKVSLDDFRYPGPRPRSRETALVMIADGCEARARAERPHTEVEIRAIIKDVIEKRLASGQFDETSLTMRDLHIVQDSFTNTLRGIYHPRIEYPKLEERALSTDESETFPDAARPVPPSPEPDAPLPPTQPKRSPKTPPRNVPLSEPTPHVKNP